MKKLVAFILIILFVTSSAIEVYNSYTAGKAVAFSVAENEDNEEEKNIEKEPEFAKDKLLPCFIINVSNALVISDKYIITHSYILPHPYISEEINPPEVIS